MEERSLQAREASDAGPALTPGSQRDLVRQLREGNAEALSWVFHTYRVALLQYAERLSRGCAEAEDIVQEALTRFWVRRRNLREDGSVRALLFIAVRTIARDEYRRWGRRMVVGEPPSSPDSPQTPLEETLGRELGARVADALGELSPRRRQVFRLVREEGMTHAEAAETLGLTTRTVKNTMTSALSELRRKLEPAIQ